MTEFLTLHHNAVRIRFHIQPKASKNEIVGIHGDALKLRITAPPVEGAANKEIVKFLSKLLKRPKSAITIISGETGRAKVVEIETPGDMDSRAFMASVKERLVK